MTRRCFLALVSVTALLAVSAPASAAYAPPRLVRGCPGEMHLAALAGGALWGATACNSDPRISVVSAHTGSAWRRSSTPWTGRVLAVADDGSTTFVAWNDTHGRLQLGRKPHGGPASASALLSAQGAGGVTLLARGGKWWAVWSTSGCTGHLEGCSSVLMQAKSLGRGVRPERVLAKPDQVGTHDVFPTMAFRSEDDVVLVFLRRDEQGDVIHYAGADLQGTWTDGLFPASQGARWAFGPMLTVAGGRVIVGWVRDQLPVVSWQDASGAWLTFAVPYHSQTGWVRVAASGGRAFVAHGSCFAYRGAWTCRSYIATLRSDGTVASSTELSAGAKANAMWGLNDLVAVGGTATAALSADDALVTRAGF